jgi:hypothetical protein
MPKLMAFLPCERVVIDQEDNLMSIVSIIERINVHVSPEVPIPPGVVAFSNWVLVAIWRGIAQEVGKSYEQHLQVIQPGGKIDVDAILPFDMTDIWFKSKIKMQGFPVDTPGDVLLRMSIREAHHDGKWQKAGEYPIMVLHVPSPVSIP